MPVVLVGANINDKPNFMAVAWFSKVNSNPPMMLISLGKRQYTGEGIRENKTFSINIPNKNLVKEVDYCGIVSGRKENKARLFEVFYGETRTAPMIQECPVIYELRLIETKELPGCNLFIGEIVAAYTDQENLKGQLPDLPKIEPFMLVESPANYYYNLEAHLRDYRGIVHRVPLGSLHFMGWRNLSVNIPKHIPQTVRYLPMVKPLSLRYRVDAGRP